MPAEPALPPIALEARVRAAEPYASSAVCLQGPRPLNEDAVYADATRGLYLVADGFGGPGKGDLAARLVVESVRDGRGAPQQLLEEANRRLCDAVAEAPDRKGLGVTVVLAAVSGREVELLHAGEVRAYLLRASEARLLTQDHTLAGQLVRTNQLSAEAAANHPARKTILRYLGKEEGLRLERVRFTMEPGDRLLLATDGLYRHLDAAGLAALAAGSPAPALEAAADAAFAAGADDNASAVLLAEAEVAEPVVPPGSARSRLCRELRGLVEAVLTAAQPQAELAAIAQEVLEALGRVDGVVGAGYLRGPQGSALATWLWYGGGAPSDGNRDAWNELVAVAQAAPAGCAQRGERLVADLPPGEGGSRYVLAVHLAAGTAFDEALANHLEVAGWVPVMARVAAR